MAFILKNLLSLTNEKLAQAVADVSAKQPVFAEVDTSASANCFATLLQLIEVDQPLDKLTFGGWVLTKLLRVDSLPWEALKAARLFLRFKTDETYHTCLFDASDVSHFKEYTEELLQMLIESGAQVNRPGYKYGGTVLHAAALDSSSESIACLLKVGADPHFRDLWNDKPIHNIMRMEKHDKSASAAHLFFAMLDQPTLTQVINILFDHSMSDNFREEVCHVLMQRYHQRFEFSEEELLTGVRNRHAHLSFPGIRLLDPIGEGTNSTIYLCENIQSRKTYVLKYPKARPEEKRAVEEEIAVLRQFNHPHVIKMISTAIKEETLCFLMPHAELGSLYDYAKGKFGATLAGCFYSFSLQINDGLRYIHSKGYAHLDFSSRNILLFERKGELPLLRISDFGAARKFGEVGTQQVTTEEFRSPELFKAFGPYTRENDTYSVGIIMGCMVTKKSRWKPSHLSERQMNAETPEKQRKYQLAIWCAAFKPEERPDHDQIETFLHQHFKRTR